MAEVDQIMNASADAAAGNSASVRKRKNADELDSDSKLPKTEGAKDKAPVSRAREVRLEQNRKAARESRRRKKVMIEELQRSVIFFSRANNTLKQQNDDLTRLLMQAQAQVNAADGDGKVEATPAVTTNEATDAEQQAEAATAATQAMFESQGYPAAAARAAAQTMTANSQASGKSFTALPSMQPGSTMQAMANFQQAAAQAMQAAMQGMQNIPGLNLNQLSAAPAGANAQQAYTDTMTALAMQQAAAAAAAGQQFVMQPGSIQFIPHPIMTWAGQQQDGEQQEGKEEPKEEQTV